MTIPNASRVFKDKAAADKFLREQGANAGKGAEVYAVAPFALTETVYVVELSALCARETAARYAGATATKGKAAPANPATLSDTALLAELQKRGLAAAAPPAEVPPAEVPPAAPAKKKVA